MLCLLSMVELGCVGTEESFLSSLRSWMVFWKVIRSEKFHPFRPILKKRMNLKIRPFSNESSVLGEFGRFLVIGMKFKFSRRINSDSYILWINLDVTDDSWKSSIQPRFVRFRLNRLNLEKTDVFTRIILSSKNIRLAWLAVVMNNTKKSKHTPSVGKPFNRAMKIFSKFSEGVRKVCMIGVTYHNSRLFFQIHFPE